MIKLLKYLAPYSTSVALILALVFFQSLSELFLPTIMSEIVDIGIVQGDIPFIIRMGVLMVLITAAGTGCSVLASYLSAKSSTGFGKILRQKVFSQVESFSLQEINRLGTATLITRTTNDITQIQQVLIMALRMIVSAPLMLVGGIILAVSKDAKLSLVLVFALPLIALSIYLIASRGMPLFKAIQNKLDKLNLVLRENLTGIRVIRAFNRLEHEKSRFYTANLDLTDTTMKVHRIMAAMMPSMMLIMNLTSVSIIWFGGVRIEQGQMQVGDMMAFIQYAMLIMFSLVMLSMMFVMIPRAAVSAVRINEVLETEPRIKDKDDLEIQNNKKGPTIEFQNVSFSYPEAELPAIINVSFQAKAGEVTAVIGGTGSGKSTLLKLILRFYEVSEGQIMVRGQEISSMPIAELRNKIGYIPQKALLFTGTIAENIRFGKKEAADEEIRWAAELAQASEFIDTMNNKYTSAISQGGLNLSGGQKQRLAIARALVRRPQIYIFDDSFSALDYKTDAKLRAALKEEIKEATVLIVAQRVSTVRDADQIIVLDQGRIAGMGRHEELLLSCKVYREIVASQLTEEEMA